MSSADVYGPLVSAPTVERGVETCLRYWLGPYVGEALAQNGHDRTHLPDPTDLVRVAEFTAQPPQGVVAMVVVATPGTVGDAESDGEFYTLTWDIRATILADLGDRLLSREAAQMYAAAAGTALAHQGVAAVEADLKTWATDDDGNLLTLAGSSVRLRGETYREIRQLPGVIGGEARVTVTVEGARALHGGPETPPINPDTGLPGRDPAESGIPTAVVPALIVTRDPVEEPRP